MSILKTKSIKNKEIRTLRLPALGSDFYCLVRVTGLEPALRRESDPKSDASANSAIPARVNEECKMQNAEFRIVQNVLAFGTHVRDIIP